MAKKKTVKKDSAPKDSVPKAKGLFDHINHIRGQQDPGYYNSLSEADRKSWSNYMICRFLSMQENNIDLINEIQKYQGLDPKYFYFCCLAVVPKGRAFFPYIKGDKEGKYSKELLELLSKHFGESKRNVVEYLSLMGEDEIRKIVSMYGYTEKEVDKLISS